MVQRKPFKKQPVQKSQRSRGPTKIEDPTLTNADVQLPLSLQQSLLHIFRDACIASTSSDIDTTLQEVKGHLYNRDFATAFGKDEYLQAYAARWSPTRALGYTQIFYDIKGHIFDALASKQNSHFGALVTSNGAEIIQTCEADDIADMSKRVSNSLVLDAAVSESEVTSPESTFVGDDQRPLGGSSLPTSSLKMACVGGGAGAEIVALAGWLKFLKETRTPGPPNKPFGRLPDQLEVLCLDIARWDNVVKDLHYHCVTPPILSKYASAVAQAANAAFLPSEDLQVTFEQQDCLNITASDINTTYQDQDLVTIMFTLNELYSVSVPKTQQFLYSLTASMKEGALLLVVDSPGSYSAVTINETEKKYPMQWLLNHTLLEESAKKGDSLQGKRWEKLESDESRWFRLREELKYPIELENMRYQIHLYRRCGVQS